MSYELLLLEGLIYADIIGQVTVATSCIQSFGCAVA